MPQAPLMLGVSGLRGITGQSLTPEIAARFGFAFGSWLKANARDQQRKSPWGGRPLVILGADGRKGFEDIRDAAGQGLAAAECHVVSIGVAMTPTVGIVTDHEDADGAMIVTASHNPQQWNGLKCLVRREVGGIGGEIVSACAPAAETASAIIALYDRTSRAAAITPSFLSDVGSDTVGMHLGPVLSGIADLHPDAPGANWIQKLDLIRKHRFAVVLDSVNGAGSAAAKEMLEVALACRLTHLNDSPSGLFPHPPEPTRENLTALCEEVRRHKADIGFAQDPDADRLAIIDEQGRYIGEEYTLALAAESLLSSNPKSKIQNPKSPVLVTNLSTSRMLDDIAARHGARVLRTPVGEANVVEVMKHEKAAGRNVLLGGEGNGGVIWPKVTYVRDSLSAMALVLALMARTGKKVSELVAALPAYAIEKRKVDLARKEDAQPTIKKLAAAYQQHTLDLQDGIRIDFAQGPLAHKAWLHVRASNTEPIMRLIAEAPTPADANRILDEAARIAAS